MTDGLWLTADQNLLASLPNDDDDLAEEDIEVGQSLAAFEWCNSPSCFVVIS